MILLVQRGKVPIICQVRDRAEMEKVPMIRALQADTVDTVDVMLCLCLQNTTGKMMSRTMTVFDGFKHKVYMLDYSGSHGGDNSVVVEYCYSRTLHCVYF